MTGSRSINRRWTASEVALLTARYPHEPTGPIARDLGRPVGHLYAKADHLGLRKTPEYLASTSACRLRRGRVLVDSAKAENDFLRITGASEASATGFIAKPEGLPQAPGAPRLVRGKAQSGST